MRSHGLLLRHLRLIVAGAEGITDRHTTRTTFGRIIVLISGEDFTAVIATMATIAMAASISEAEILVSVSGSEPC